MHAPSGDWSTETESCNLWSKRFTSKAPSHPDWIKFKLLWIFSVVVEEDRIQRSFHYSIFELAVYRITGRTCKVVDASLLLLQIYKRTQTAVLRQAKFYLPRQAAVPQWLIYCSRRAAVDERLFSPLSTATRLLRLIYCGHSSYNNISII